MKNKLKRITKKMAKLITFNNENIYNKLKQLINNVRSWHSGNKYKRACRRGKVISCDIRELFYENAVRNRYDRLDTIVRYLFVENYYGNNEAGYELYKKMQQERLGSKEAGLEWCNRFTKLIQSYEERGYDYKISQITVGKDMEIHDGSHRTALCLYNKQFNIVCNIINYSKHVEYGLDWFRDHHFTMEEINIIIKKYNDLINEYKLPFVLIIETKQRSIYEECEKMLGYIYGNENIIATSDFISNDSTSFKRIYSINVIKPKYGLNKIGIFSITNEKVSKLLNEKFGEKIIFELARNYEETNILLEKAGSNHAIKTAEASQIN